MTKETDLAAGGGVFPPARRIPAPATVIPPTIPTTGDRDLFRFNTVRLHRALLRAGMEAELHVWEDMRRGGFFGAPENPEVRFGRQPTSHAEGRS